MGSRTVSQSTRREIPRPVRIVVLSLAVAWIVVAVTVLVVRRLPDAQATGRLERAGAAFQPYLGSGWYPMELAVLSEQRGRPSAMIASNWSDSAHSTLRVPGGWSGMRLYLASVTCPSGAPEVLRLSTGAGPLARVTIRPGWNWYAVTLVPEAPSGPAGLRTVRLGYSCTLRQAVGGVGLPGHLLAVAIGGLHEGTGAR